MESLAVTADFWRGKRVVVTGHTGFKGSWLVAWLTKLGAKVTGLSLPPNTCPALFDLLSMAAKVDHQLIDIRDADKVQQALTAANPEVLFHLAAQPLVIDSYQQPVQTMATNVMGTAHVLDAARHCPALRAAVIITTDKVYRPVPNGARHVESDHLGGHDPYSASKACTELLVDSFRSSFFASDHAAQIATVRAGNVIGGGDFAENRLVPDICRAWASDRPVVIRQPAAIRPWQHVLDALHGYLLLAHGLWQQQGLDRAWNIGPAATDMWPVAEIVEYMQTLWNGAKGMKIEAMEYHENPSLLLNSDAITQATGWRPVWGLSQALEQTTRWYQLWADGLDVNDLTNCQIEQFMKDATRS
ncbi:CDP-glucose 4,6-dehydratase [Neiella sp. HB171785]|uniref:CDP-glucose 4,6-dehydratase n=1 Tax=Neiella litorisoli TaxID=2771431 RepID=A0A8J6UMH2_9GAMM|nr:CDP-glucose 4,6-dehydratase [Neiella litorisoli]MBD1390840.1 CDP-glucose 4,6-dehydratase [Neiella litorisoli]